MTLGILQCLYGHWGQLALLASPSLSWCEYRSSLLGPLRKFFQLCLEKKEYVTTDWWKRRLSVQDILVQVWNVTCTVITFSYFCMLIFLWTFLLRGCEPPVIPCWIHSCLWNSYKLAWRPRPSLVGLFIHFGDTIDISLFTELFKSMIFPEDYWSSSKVS